MKVIHVTYDASPYGITTFLINLLVFLNKNYEDLFLGVAFHANGPCIDEYNKLEIPIYSLGHKTAKDIRSIYEFYNIFKNYDIVNLHTHSPFAFLAAKWARKKIIFTFHGALGFKKEWTDFPKRMFYLFAMNISCDRITFASKSSLSRYIEGVNCKPKDEKIELFPYGLEVEKIISIKSRQEVRADLMVNEKFVIGTAARMDPMKRIDRLIEAFANLPKSDEFELVIIGTGDKSYQVSLSDQVKSHNLQNRVHFLGYRSDALNIINSFDFFVLPSNNEPFGLALLEAMALGVPSAVFEDGGGAVDILGDSGFVVRNPQELRDTILRLNNDVLLQQSISKKVKERAKQFDIKYTADNLYRIYTEVLKGPHGVK